MTSRLHWAARVAGGTMLTGGMVLAALAPPASADSPIKTGWWNTASGGGQSAPQPTTPAGELHVAVAPNATLAIAAVAFQVFSPNDAPTLTLQIDASTKAGTPAVDACVTKSTAWKAGGDQAGSAAPAYNCTHYFSGIASSSGSSITFYLDHNAIVGGLYSVAIVPATNNSVPQSGVSAPVDTTQPFSVDFKAPLLSGTSSGSGSAASGGGVPSGAGAAGPPSGAGTGGPGSAAVGAPAAGGGSVGSGNAPAVSLPAAAGASSTGSTGSAPVVAPSGAATAAAPRSLAASTSPTSNRTRNIALGLLVAIGVVLLGTSNNGRLGRVPVQATPGLERGLGRFSRPRSARPRPLM